MSVATFDAEDLFIVRVKKNLLANPDNSWVNNYELQASTSGSTDELLGAALKIVDFERQLHYAGVRFSQLSISTWEPDSKPYNPSSFISSPMSTVGLRVVSGDPLPLNQAWGITRVAQYGRFGHLFLRGSLIEGDVTAPSGKQVFSNLSSIATELDDAITTSLLSDLFGDAARSTLQLVMVNKTGTQIRPLVGFSAGGISAVPQDHAWFNRTTPATP